MNEMLVKELNGYLANVGVMYLKLHNFHWNVRGENFKAIHEYLETLYEGFATSLDETAEAMKIQGEYPLGTMKDFVAAGTISEIPSRDYSPKEVHEMVYEDFKTLIKECESIRKNASQEDNYCIVALMETQLFHLQKSLWFLSAMKK